MLELLSRVAHLIGLCITPRGLSPEPLETSGLGALLAVVLLSVPVGFTVWLYRSYGALESKVAIALWVVADAALLYKAHATYAAGEPLLRGYYLAAPLLWSAIGATLATLAGQFLGVSFKNKRTAAFVATVGIGILLFKDAHGYVASTKEQWRDVLAKDPSHERALGALSDELSHDPKATETLLGCVAKRPNACVCRTLLGERALDAERTEKALEDLTQASCDGHALEPRAKAALTQALALAKRYDEAEPLAVAGLAKTPEQPRYLLALALSHNARGEADAVDLTRRAVKAGAGGTAEMLLIQLLIRGNDLTGAKLELDAYLKKHPDDARAVYNAALVADREGVFNKAREGYLKALKLKPDLADARYNLVMLTWRNGATAEAKHHAEKFAQSYPEDPRRLDLLTFVGIRP